MLNLHKNCPCSELFWSAFSRIRIEYGEIRSNYRGKYEENTDQNNFEYGHFLRSVIFSNFLSLPDAWSKLSTFYWLLEEKWIIRIILHSSLSNFCFFFRGMIWISLKLVILSSKTFKEQTFLMNTKIFKQCILFGNNE